MSDHTFHVCDHRGDIKRALTAGSIWVSPGCGGNLVGMWRQRRRHWLVRSVELKRVTVSIVWVVIRARSDSLSFALG